MLATSAIAEVFLLALIAPVVIYSIPCDAHAMWGAVVGVAAASLALAVLHQTLEATGLSPAQPEKPRELAEPGKDFKTKAGECGRTFGAPLARPRLQLPSPTRLP